MSCGWYNNVCSTKLVYHRLEIVLQHDHENSYWLFFCFSFYVGRLNGLLAILSFFLPFVFCMSLYTIAHGT